MSDFWISLVNAQVDVGLGKPILWREIVGNLFGLASMLLGMRRRVSAWIFGILGNLILFTVFLGAMFHTPQDKDLWGQAGRQVFFIITSVYGWITWSRYRRTHPEERVGVQPRWASARERALLVGGGLAMWVVFSLVLKALGSWGPVADGWILAGSILATYSMARGWVEFWFIWLAVDAVGVPLLLRAQYYPSALMYIAYAAFCVLGLVQWWRVAETSPKAGAEA